MGRNKRTFLIIPMILFVALVIAGSTAALQPDISAGLTNPTQLAIPPGLQLALDEALTELAKEAPEQAQVIELRFFVGLTHEEVAEILGVSVITVKRYWRYARVWLQRRMEGCEDSLS